MSDKPKQSWNWQYETTVEYCGKTYHVWSYDNQSAGYVAYTLTHQPVNQKISYVKPIGQAGHYVGKETLFRQTGIKI